MLALTSRRCLVPFIYALGLKESKLSRLLQSCLKDCHRLKMIVPDLSVDCDYMREIQRRASSSCQLIVRKSRWLDEGSEMY